VQHRRLQVPSSALQLAKSPVAIWQKAECRMPNAKGRAVRGGQTSKVSRKKISHLPARWWHNSRARRRPKTYSWVCLHGKKSVVLCLLKQKFFM